MNAASSCFISAETDSVADVFLWSLIFTSKSAAFDFDPCKAQFSDSLRPADGVQCWTFHPHNPEAVSEFGDAFLFNL